MNLISIDWEKHRNISTNTLDLHNAYLELFSYSYLAYNYIDKIQNLQPIRSRQVAATILCTANMFARADDVFGES